MTALTVSGVTKAFGSTPVLLGVDLHVPAHTLTAVLGPSGCGKTTLLRLVAGFDDPDSGTIALDDEVVVGAGRRRPPQRRRIGYVPQEGALFPHLSVAANVGFGLPRRERTPGRIAAGLELVGLDPALAGRHPHELSGGQQQRVALARALAPRPEIVLLDEPFSSLDAGLRESTRRAVAAALEAAETTAVLVTHDQAEALSMASQVAVMREGRLVQLDAPEIVYRSPSDAGVAGFVGEAVLLPASISHGYATCELGSFAVRGDVEGEARILLRPEQLVLSYSGTGGVEARVRDVSYFGHDAAVRLELLPNGTEVLARVAGHDRPALGSVVRLSVAGEALAYPGEAPAPALQPQPTHTAG
ncbi:MAG TPA: ABC transporter ATP-binding protein [Mycobacteriales bacterium]|jgi:iron(III) transport system ATP-binding protein|nr:ABC transporter ATP-binding protein [Mycobacteriales bacterium]